MFRAQRKAYGVVSIMIVLFTSRSRGIISRLTIFMPCQTSKLSAKTPVRVLSRSTRRTVHSGSVSRTDLRSRDANVKYGGSK